MFENEITDLRNALANDDRTRGRFQFGEIADSYAVVKLADGTIGNTNCHYEVRKSNDNVRGNEVMYSVEVHFQGVMANYENFIPFLNSFPDIDTIPFGSNDICRRLRGNRYAIRYGKGLPLNTPNIVSILKEQLLCLELAIGNDLKQIIANA